MGSPSRGALGAINPMLSNFAVSFAGQRLVSQTGSAFGLTPDFIFPIVPHTEEGMAGTYLTLDVGNSFQTPDTRRTSGTDYKSIDWGLSSSNYRLEDHGLGKNWDDNDVKAGVGPVQLNRRTTQIITNNVVAEWDRRVNTIVTTTGNFTLSNTSTAATIHGGAAQWSTSTADIIRSIDVAREQIFLNSGYDGALRAVAGRNVWYSGFKINDDIIASLQAAQQLGGSSDITPRLVGEQLLEVDLRINSNLRNNAGEVAAGTFTGTLDFGDNMLIFAEPMINVDAQALGVNFQGETFQTRTRDVGDRSHRVTVGHMVVEHLVDQRFGYLISDCLA